MPFSDFASGAGQIVGTGLGLLLEGHEDQRQREQQKALTDIQVKGSKELSGFNLSLQKDLWNYTNYENQVKHLKDAGLNPALLYGKGGGGGASASINPGSVSGGSAGQNPGEVGQMAGLGLQMASQLSLNSAQAENLRAQADLARAEAEKKRGVDTALGHSQIEALAAQTSNDWAKTKLTGLQAEATQIQNQINSDIQAKGYVQEKLISEIEEINMRWTNLADSHTLFNATKDTMIQIKNQELANMVLNGKLTEAETQKTQELINQGWKNLDIKAKEQAVEQSFKEGLLKYMPIDRIIKGIDLLASMKSFK